MRLKGFTIAELVIVLVISGIVISMSFWGISVLTKYGRNTSFNYSQQIEHVQTLYTLATASKMAVSSSFKDNQVLTIVDANNDSISILTQNDSLFFIAQANPRPIKINGGISILNYRNDSLLVSSATEGEELRIGFSYPASTEINNLMLK